MKMWPMYVDYSEEECKRVLRSLELQAYSNVVSALRAQGNLSKERRKYLQDSCSILGISMERYRAEMRRVVNDEHLNTIAEKLAGPNTSTDWAIEGRRVVPLMPRVAPQTVFTAVADNVASVHASKNASLPLPSKTGVREIGNGFETMASRKRKEPPDSSGVPCKIPALENDYFNLMSFDSGNCGLPDLMPTSSGSASCDSFSPPDSTSHVSSSFSEQASVKTTASLLTSSASLSSPVKPPPKQIMLKSSSTVTTFSSYDQLSNNLLSTRPPSHSPSPASSTEELSAMVPDVAKVPPEPKHPQRLSSSVCSLKTNTILPTTSTSSSTLSSSDRLSSSSSSVGNKFLTQIRCKSSSHSRQSLPSTLGFKLNSSQMGQKGLSTKSTPSLKMKQDSASNFFSKKISPTVFSSSTTDTTSQFSISNTGESTSIAKSPVAAAKSSLKTEPTVVATSPSSNKLATVTKTFPKTTTPSSQYMARSLFSTSTKAGAKSLPPVIFNVSSSSGTSIQSSSKTTISMQNDSTKTSPQLLPKSPSVGITPSHLKIKAPNSIQYRNDGGVMRSARIVNISQPVGSRLPCAITPSAISALGLTPNIASTALRVTLPAGTLNTSAAMRVSGAAKPNVIVVHKAQMWPRAQQGAAVIMSSAASLPKISNDVTITEGTSLNQKQEKPKISGTKLAPRSIAPTQNSSLSAVTNKIPETSLLPNPLANTLKAAALDNLEISSSKSADNSAESQCKRNLLADVIEASGILETPTDKTQVPVKVKNSIQKTQVSPSIEVEARPVKKSNLTSLAAEIASVPKEINIFKAETSKITIDLDSKASHAEDDSGDFNNKLSERAAEQNKMPEPLVTSQGSENLQSSTENSTSLQTSATKEKNL